MGSKLQPGQKAPPFDLPGIDGQRLCLADQVGRVSATVVLFLCNHCPYVHAYLPRLVALQDEFAPGGSGGNGVRLIGICSNDAETYPQDSFENMKPFADEWGLNFPYLRDEDQSVAKAYGAERTPEVFVLDSKGVCRYEGGIDDNHKEPSKVKIQPLRDALVDLTAGRDVRTATTHAIGCTIKWKQS